MSGSGYEGLIVTGLGSGLSIGAALAFGYEAGKFKSRPWLPPLIFAAWLWSYPFPYAAWWAWARKAAEMFR